MSLIEQGLKTAAGLAIDSLVRPAIGTWHTYYRVVNRNRSRVLIHTDSRGYEVTRRHNKKNPVSSAYTKFLTENYYVDYFLAPEKHTTLLDFIDIYSALQKSARNYDYVVLHTGVVDFATRHQSTVEHLYEIKREKLLKVFSEGELHEHLKSKTGYTFEGEPTLSLYSLDMAAKLARYIRENCPEVIWIGCNKILSNWDGSYWRKRPDDSFVISEYSKVFEEIIPNVVSLAHWNEDDIKRYTCDNVHLTESGFTYIRDRLIQAMQPVSP